MALRSKKTIGGLALLLASSIPIAARTEFLYEARHDHWRKSCIGSLTITSDSISFQERSPKKKRQTPHDFQWRFADIQQVLMEPHRVSVLTYEDVRWKLGADRQQTFELLGDESFSNAYALLKDHLDQRFVAAIPDDGIKPLWRIAVKHELGMKASQGVLAIGADRIVYRTESEVDSRTWRYADIENISMEGPFQLTLTTFEHARTHYGNRKSFNFQLKEVLPEARFNELWRRLEEGRSHGIPTIQPTPKDGNR